MATTSNESIFGSLVEARESNDLSGEVTDWYSADEAAANWGKSFPYQLALWDAATNSIVKAPQAPFTLPIPPQSLNISMPFASTVEATMGGVIEQNNGAPFRQISMQGTTGVLPLRGTTAKGPDSSNLVSIFAGTVNSINSLATTSGLTTPVSNLVETDNLFVDSGSGLGQFILLRNWLEKYAEFKKKNARSGLFLALCIWKEQSAYICTPVSFDVPRSASSPLEYNYSIVLKAWKRIKLEVDLKTGEQHTRPRTPSKLAQLGNAIDAARRTLENAQQVMAAVRLDVEQAIINPIKQTSLFLKDATNTVVAVADFPADLASDLLGYAMTSMSPSDFIAQLQDQVAGVPAEYDRLKDMFDRLQSIARIQYSPISSKDRVRGLESPRLGANQRDWVSNAAILLAQYRPPFAVPSSLPQSLQDKVAYFTDLAKTKTRVDYERYRDDTLKFLADYSTFVGVGDTTFSATYSQPTGNIGRTEPTDQDWEVMGALSDLAQAYDGLASSYTINRDISLIDYVAGLASKAGIAFRTPKSKFLIPFPYGATLERLSAQYLGTPDRWTEIAALNGLRSPYVDEVGFSDSLLVNGLANTVWVEDGTRYYVGQMVWIDSDVVAREQRRVSGIQRLSETQSILTLTGDSDLDRFTTSGNARLQAFLPDTVNSMQFIYIPSDTEPSEQDYRIKPVAGVDYYDPYVRLGGVDLLLSPSNDLVITPSGTRLAVGMTNIIQRVRIALSTPKGFLMRHPDYGLGIKPGTSTADISASELASAAKSMFGKDPMFTGVNFAKVTKNGNAIAISLGLNITGQSQPVPITVDLRR